MTQRVHAVRLPFLLPINEETSVERFVYVYLVLGDQVCVVDSGAAGSQQGIVEALEQFGKSISDVDWVVNTHEHPDHIGGNSFLQKKAQPKFAAHEKAVPWIEDLDAQYAARPIFGFYQLVGEPVQVDRALKDGDEIDLGGGTTLEVIYTPGHSLGSVSLFCPQEGVLITADAIPPVGGLPLYMDVDQTRAGLRRLADLEGVEKLYAAHSPEPLTGDEVQKVIQRGLAYLDQVGALVQAVREELPADATLEEVTRETLKRLGLSPPPVMPITLASIQAHMG
jgi:glyoxylase-like metal-dependent hydrolase (beta-lactamase superfamily II)